MSIYNTESYMNVIGIYIYRINVRYESDTERDTSTVLISRYMYLV